MSEDKNHDLLIRLDEKVSYIKDELEALRVDVRKIAILEERLNNHISGEKTFLRRVIAAFIAAITSLSSIIAYLLSAR